MMIKGLTLRKN